MNVRYAVVAAVAVLAGSETLGAAEKAAPADTVRIGIVASLFRENNSLLADALVEPFRALVQAQTGLSSQVGRVDGAFRLARQVADKDLHLGVFQGIEFAWVRQQSPEFRPLIIAVNQQRHLHAVLVVRGDSKAGRFADLAGKTLSLPRTSRIHCNVFLDRACEHAGQPDPSRFFSRYTRTANAEDALDELVDGAHDALVIDGIALDAYQRRKPGRFEKLKVVEKSAVFPATVVAYRPGSLDQKILQQFQAGLMRANQNALSRHLMSFWHLSAFEAVPDDYEETLTAIIKSYPPPKPAAVDGKK